MNPPNAVHYTTLIDACGRAGQLGRAFATFEEMQVRLLRFALLCFLSLFSLCLSFFSR